MLKRLLFLVLVVIGAEANAQSLVISELDDYVTGEPSTELLQAHATITNSSSNSIDVMVRFETVTSIPAGAGHYFCWAVCYNEGAVFNGFETPATHSINIDAGGSVTNFYSDYVPNNSVGTTTFRYTFYDKNNTSDASSAEITFDTRNVGIEDVFASNNSGISEAYPNPANSNVRMNYSLEPGSNDATLDVYSMLGSRVRTLSINEKSGTVSLDVSSLPAGMYFYTLNVDGKSVGTKKMLVTK